jgi:hypothetical protein
MILYCIEVKGLTRILKNFTASSSLSLLLVDSDSQQLTEDFENLYGLQQPQPLLERSPIRRWRRSRSWDHWDGSWRPWLSPVDAAFTCEDACSSLEQIMRSLTEVLMAFSSRSLYLWGHLFVAGAYHKIDDEPRRPLPVWTPILSCSDSWGRCRILKVLTASSSLRDILAISRECWRPFLTGRPA